MDCFDKERSVQEGTLMTQQLHNAALATTNNFTSGHFGELPCTTSVLHKVNVAGVSRRHVTSA